MKSTIVCFSAGLLVPYLGFAQQATRDTLLQEKEIEAVTVTGIPYITELTRSTLKKTDLQKRNYGQDMPFLLNFTPSVVITSDAGAGVGYTSMRVRGSDPTRINTTINGIPLNDAESQGVFWVDLPDLASSATSVTLQRGVGTSTNGAGAFGASLNIQTFDKPTDQPFAEFNNSWGSFNTWKHTLQASTGKMQNGFVVDARLSKIKSDGFIERAFSDLLGVYLSGGYYGKNTTLRLVTLQGRERTYQAWNGVPEDRLKENRRFNVYDYENQVDNYNQNHYQAILDQQITSNLKANVSLFYVRGFGYYEEFKKKDKFSKYGLPDVVIGSTTIEKSDIIRRRWLDNHFYGGVYSLDYTQKTWNFILGGGWNRYEGKHFGEIIWAEFAPNAPIRYRYYDNDAIKVDFNQFLKIANEWNLGNNSKISAFVDGQYRYIGYNFLGFDQNLQSTQQDAEFHFFNPKAGVDYAWQKHRIYALWGIAHREPNRNDFVESTPASRPKAERLNNVELGYQITWSRANLKINNFLMDYTNELILTGKVNDVGAYTRTNVPRSRRIGVELEGNVELSKKWIWQASFTLSQNKIPEFTEFVDDYDNGTQVSFTYQNVDLAFSPRIIAAQQLTFKPWNAFEIGLLSKYVGKQYLDNTQNENRKLDAFFVNDVRFAYTVPTFKGLKELRLGLLVNNIFNEEYEPNGYTFGYIVGGQRLWENYYYPQAGTNFLLNVGLKF
ncbi:TonB-dependent receptor [Raineya orbicola]|jgi:iron complex outermembrane receptor protein|uniref:TonB-dependent Receptor Plug Domain n=1 Tax=Raineya orbicola TaxID=2016530 RepID=A0A2N3IHM7_9BACT|nr:TonB-dependent receptor plug domain-containing protein [Raineya orbicola]PKQ69758.1 TonB-dependent Receptor Plug Domain [Raineya orbicola]